MPIAKTKQDGTQAGSSACPDPGIAMLDALCGKYEDAIDGMRAMRDAALSHACANIWPV